MNHNNHENHTGHEHTKLKDTPEVKLATIKYADDDRTPLRQLVEMRLPSLILGFLLGILLPFIISRFEPLLDRDVRIAFFIPFIVYMASAVATQTENIYVRGLRTGKANFKKYLLKESLLGLILSIVFGTTSGIVAGLWFGSRELAFAVGFGMLGAVAIAPIVSLIVVEILELERTDPAVGSGPLVTVFLDSLSVLIFGLIANMFLL